MKSEKRLIISFLIASILSMGNAFGGRIRDTPSGQVKPIDTMPTEHLTSPTMAEDETPVSQEIPNDAREYKGHHYRLYKRKLSWYDAKKFCEARGAHLVTFSDTYEKHFIEKQFDPKAATWIGLIAKDWRMKKFVNKDVLEGHDFTWVDGLLVDNPLIGVSVSGRDLPQELSVHFRKPKKEPVCYEYCSGDKKLLQFICEWER